MNSVRSVVNVLAAAREEVGDWRHSEQHAAEITQKEEDFICFSGFSVRTRFLAPWSPSKGFFSVPSVLSLFRVRLQEACSQICDRKNGAVRYDIQSMRLRTSVLFGVLFTLAVSVCALAAAAQESSGQDFGADARLLYRVAACGGNEALPANLDAKVIEKHCRMLQPQMEAYRRLYLARAQPFFAKVDPPNLPARVVYPFGGGDLLSALTTYPEAQEITTLSLELAGDPRRLRTLDKKRLDDSLVFIRKTIVWLLAANDSTSTTMQATQRGDLPGQLTFFLVGLAVHGYEPVSLRFFRIERDGSLHYFSAEEIKGMEKKLAQARHGQWTPPDFSEAFANSELTFRKLGAGPNAPLRVHRHIAANLRDDYLRRTSPVLTYLEHQGRVAAMTKAASYCLWNPAFSRMRKYLLANMDFMISDSTGIPPEWAGKAGFTQVTYGSFQGSFLDASKDYNDQFRALWAGQPHRRLPFRYGYVDSAKSVHLLVTQRAKPNSR